MSLSLVPQRQRRKALGVNVVPLVDVFTTLIFFFLVVTEFGTGESLNITPPTIASAGQNTFNEQVEIAITKDGKLFFNGSEVDQNQLRGALSTLGRTANRTPVVIHADQDSALKHVAFVYDVLRSQNFENVRLQSARGGAPGGGGTGASGTGGGGR